MTDPSSALLDPPDRPWQRITGDIVVRAAPAAHVTLWYRSTEAVCRFERNGRLEREESYMAGTLRVVDFESRHAIVRVNEPSERALRRVTEPFLGPLRVLHEDRYRPDARRRGPGVRYVNRAAPVSLIVLSSDGLPQRVRYGGEEVQWRHTERTQDEAAPAFVEDIPDGWSREEYERLDLTRGSSLERASLLDLPHQETFTYRSSTFAGGYESTIWKVGADEVKVVQDLTEHRAVSTESGPAGHVPRSITGARVYASSPERLAAVTPILRERGFLDPDETGS